MATLLQVNKHQTIRKFSAFELKSQRPEPKTRIQVQLRTAGLVTDMVPGDVCVWDLHMAEIRVAPGHKGNVTCLRPQYDRTVRCVRAW